MSEDWITFPDGVSTATNATVTGLTNGVEYEFRVAAVNSVGQGEWSAVAGPYTPAVANYNETGRVIAIVAATASSDQQDYRDLSLVVPITAATTATGLLRLRELALPVPIVAGVSTPTDQADYEDPSKLVPITAATSRPTEQSDWKELLRVVPIVAQTSLPTDQADFDELLRSVPIVAQTVVPVEQIDDAAGAFQRRVGEQFDVQTERLSEAPG